MNLYLEVRKEIISIMVTTGADYETSKHIVLSSYWDEGVTQAFLQSERKRETQSDWKNQYHDYLLTPEWQCFREAILEDRNYTCEICSAEVGLQVHHLTYVRIGQELSEDVLVLCGECHKQEHGIGTTLEW
jgi:5-methylcytosine-specific restriction endonuclease McrA